MQTMLVRGRTAAAGSPLGMVSGRFSRARYIARGSELSWPADRPVQRSSLHASRHRPVRGQERHLNSAGATLPSGTVIRRALIPDVTGTWNGPRGGGNLDPVDVGVDEIGDRLSWKTISIGPIVATGRAAIRSSSAWAAARYPSPSDAA